MLGIFNFVLYQSNLTPTLHEAKTSSVVRCKHRWEGNTKMDFKEI